jgi:hypothetical protein
MNNLAQRIWYGSSRQLRQDEISWRRPAMIAGSILLLVIVRLFLPFAESDSMQVYERISDGLIDQQNWAKQSLPGVLEYPPLPTMALLLLRAFLPGNLDASAWLVAICQVWVLTYLIRMACFAGRSRVFIALAPLMLAPIIGTILWDENPFWLLLVPMASILYHMIRWQREPVLRELVIVALSCGLLALGGITGILFALTSLLTMWIYGSDRETHRHGMFTLLFAPFLYILLLIPLFNWLIIDKPWFFIERLATYYVDNAVRVPGFADNPTVAAAAIAIVALVVVTHFVRGMPLSMRLGFTLAVVSLPIYAAGIVSNSYLGGEYLLLGFVWVPLIYTWIYRPNLKEVSGASRVFMLVATAALIASQVVLWPLRVDGKERDRFVGNPPAPQELAEIIDSDWTHSRILLFDLRSAAIYSGKLTVPALDSADADRLEYNRFLVTLDYYPEIVAEQIQEEQFHLLVPPDNGKFYPIGNQAFVQIHQHGARWLMLEKMWPSGWQLWRCIRDNSKAAGE